MNYSSSDAVSSAIRRARITKVDDSGTQQKVDLIGLASEKPRKIVRVQPHGFSSYPVDDAEGVMVQMSGRSDRTLFLGGEHKDHRPKNLPKGGTIIYDADGNIARIVKDDMQITHSKKIVIKVGGSTVTIEPDKITYDAAQHILNGVVHLGGEGGTLVALCGGGCASKVYAV